MPYSITTKDGITINNIPDDVAPDSQSLKDRVAAIRAGGGQQPAPEPQLLASHAVEPEMVPSHTQGARLPYSVEPPSNMEKMVLGLPIEGEPETTAAGLAGAAARGLGPYAAATPMGPVGVAAVGAAKLIGDPLAHGVNSLLEFFGVDQKHRQITPSEGMEMLMDKLGIYKPRTSAERVVKAGAEAAGSGLGSAALGQGMAQASAPLVAGAGRMLAAQPAQQIAGGAGAGMASQIAAESGVGMPGQIAAGLAGGMLGAKVATPRTALNTAYQLPAIAEAEKAGINVMTSDVMPPRTFAGKFLQGLGEKIPIAGTGGVRRTQQGQRIEAIKDLLHEYGTGDVTAASDEVMRDVLTKRSADITKYANLKKGVIEKLGQAGTVPVDNTVKAIDDQIAKLSALNTKEVVPVIDRLSDWKGAIQGQTMDNVELLRAQIGESFKAPEMAASRSIGEKALTGIYRPLREDMGNFIKANGDRQDYTKWRVANARLAESMGELENTTFRSVLKKGEATPEVIQKMLFSKQPSDAKQLMSSLTADGKRNAKIAILSKAAEDAGGIENLSPEKFVSSVKKLGAPMGVFFEGDEAQRVNGLVRALKLTEHASKAALVPPTGVQALPFVAGIMGTMLGGPVATLATAGGTGGLARVYESAPVRNLLMNLAKTKAGSPEEAAMFKRLIAVSQSQQATKQENE